MLKVRASVSGITSVDSRGNSSPANKWSDKDLGKVRKHIDSVPTYESHTRNDSQKKYLPPHYTISKFIVNIKNYRILLIRLEDLNMKKSSIR